MDNQYITFGSSLQFNHSQQMKYLYENGLHIDHDLLKEILSLPQETLLADLETVLQDARDRYEIFREMDNLSDSSDFNEQHLSFPLHALCLLQEIDCDKSLELVLKFLDNDHDFIKFWLNDHITETIWNILFFLGKDRIEELTKYIISYSEGGDIYSKSAASRALQQIALHFSDKKKTVLEHYEVILGKILEDKELKIFEWELNAFIACDYVESFPPEISPLLKQIYDENLAFLGVAGTYESLVDKEMRGNEDDQREPVFFSIFELYDYIINNWYGYSEQYQKDREAYEQRKAEEHITELLKQNKNSSPKVGRNDPCPCGSGKKYKKCCIEKE